MTDAPRLPRSRAVVVLVAGIIALLVTPLAAALLRDTLHVGCSLLDDSGDVEPGWICGDGVGLLFPGIAMVVIPAVALVVAFVLTLVRPPWRPARRVLALLAVAAVMSPPLVALSLVSTATRPEGETAWWQSVAPSFGVALLGVVLGAVSTFIPRGAIVLVIAAVAALLVAVVLQPGLAAGLVVAVGLITATAARASDVARRDLRLDGA